MRTMLTNYRPIWEELLFCPENLIHESVAEIRYRFCGGLIANGGIKFCFSLSLPNWFLSLESVHFSFPSEHYKSLNYVIKVFFLIIILLLLLDFQILMDFPPCDVICRQREWSLFSFLNVIFSDKMIFMWFHSTIWLTWVKGRFGEKSMTHCCERKLGVENVRHGMNGCVVDKNVKLLHVGDETEIFLIFLENSLPSSMEIETSRDERKRDENNIQRANPRGLRDSFKLSLDKKLQKCSSDSPQDSLCPTSLWDRSPRSPFPLGLTLIMRGGAAWGGYMECAQFLYGSYMSLDFADNFTSSLTVSKSCPLLISSLGFFSFLNYKFLQ